MPEAFIALGSNIGDRADNIREAVWRLREAGVEIVRLSSIFESKPILIEDQPDFYNAVVMVRTVLTPRDLLMLCRGVEDDMGRVRDVRYGPRVIDLDIILFGRVILNEPDLQLPHPGLLERSFVTVPLLEIAPEAVMPDGELISALTASHRVTDVRRVSGLWL